MARTATGRQSSFKALRSQPRERPETALALMRVLCERLAPYDAADN